MSKNKMLAAKFSLNLIILLLLVTIVQPAWQVVQIRFALQSGEESGATLAERYLLLGDWPSGHGENLLAQVEDFKVQSTTAQKDSMTEKTPGAPFQPKAQLTENALQE
ncbi:hypothetical protein [Shewanella sedimentimangrovi]|uniref:Uncharacterized protein n=1 Tax=Shewanella sedimentimangrovi TaxID=2814293 RepID=A0ABX7R004_9GAMM|nr:hypothetical protein [Shewanella sedimentimangrovi]QSX36829.1 hypothetical protein JYB85_16380 [Shewanella sedimentimangrovi]